MLCGSVVNYITGIREWYQFEKKDSTNLSYVKNGKSTAVLSETLHKNRLLKIAEKRFSAQTVDKLLNLECCLQFFCFILIV